MTPEELSEIYYINKEIIRIQKDIEDLKDRNFYKTNVITDMPRGGCGKDAFVDYAEDMKTLEDMLRYNLKKLQVKRDAIEKYINSISDPQTRLIVRLRAINNMSWYEIGEELEIDRRTASKKFFNYFRKCTECDMGV